MQLEELMRPTELFCRLMGSRMDELISAFTPEHNNSFHNPAEAFTNATFTLSFVPPTPTIGVSE
jgi:hypothetical protein